MSEPQAPEEEIDRPLDDPKRVGKLQKTIKTRLKTALINAGHPDIATILDSDLDSEEISDRNRPSETVTTNEVLENGTQVVWEDVFGYIPGHTIIRSHRIDKPLEEQGVYLRKSEKGPSIEHRSVVGGRTVRYFDSTFMERKALAQVGQIEARLTLNPQTAGQ